MLWYQSTKNTRLLDVLPCSFSLENARKRALFSVYRLAFRNSYSQTLDEA